MLKRKQRQFRVNGNSGKFSFIELKRFLLVAIRYFFFLFGSYTFLQIESSSELFCRENIREWILRKKKLSSSEINNSKKWTNGDICFIMGFNNNINNIGYISTEFILLNQTAWFWRLPPSVVMHYARLGNHISFSIHD